MSHRSSTSRDERNRMDQYLFSSCLDQGQCGAGSSSDKVFTSDVEQARPLKPRYGVSLLYGVRRRPRLMFRSGGSREARSRSYTGERRRGGGDSLEGASAGEQILGGGAGEELLSSTGRDLLSGARAMAF